MITPDSLASFKILATGLTDVGKVRSTNQDSFLIDESGSLYIVADGMGGHAGGEIASQLCVETVKLSLQEMKHHLEQEAVEGSDHFANKLCSSLAAAINYASTKIYERALEDPNLRGMGTTATVCHILGDKAFVAHVGDSRLYLLREKFLYQITCDHSLVSEQVKAGLITKEEAELHHLKNVITRSVGYQEEEDVDTYVVNLEKNDILLLCSDGLHGKINDGELSNLILEYQLDAATHLVNLANSRGGEDNITVLLVKVSN